MAEEKFHGAAYCIQNEIDLNVYPPLNKAVCSTVSYICNVYHQFRMRYVISTRNMVRHTQTVNWI